MNSLARYLPESCQHFLHVPASLQLRREDVPDHAGPVDQVRDAPGEQSQSPGNPVASADLALAVGQEQEWQTPELREAPVRSLRVGTDADHLGAGFLEHLMTVPERAGLRGAAGSVVLGIEEEDDLRLAPKVRQAHHLAGR